jgi:hypothetical protein
MAITTEFEPCRPSIWTGRYARVMGDSTVFHLRYVGGRLWPVLLWETESGTAICRALDSVATQELAAAVERAKRYAGGEGGGSFLINEYGKVLLPASEGDGRRFLAGRLKVAIRFENPFSPQKPIDLGDSKGLQNGDAWNLPYVGIPYHLHRNGSLYFFQYDGQGGRSVYPSEQDFELIRAIRNLRPYGAVRILITPGGLVLTKVPDGRNAIPEARWRTVFVEKVNFNRWFEEE